MNRDLETHLMTALAAYGLIKLFEGLTSRPRPNLVIVTGDDALEFVKELTAESEGDRE